MQQAQRWLRALRSPGMQTRVRHQYRDVDTWITVDDHNLGGIVAGDTIELTFRSHDDDFPHRILIETKE